MVKGWFMAQALPPKSDDLRCIFTKTGINEQPYG
jgi:hypothetical protein